MRRIVCVCASFLNPCRLYRFYAVVGLRHTSPLTLYATSDNPILLDVMKTCIVLLPCSYAITSLVQLSITYYYILLLCLYLRWCCVFVGPPSSQGARDKVSKYEWARSKY